MNHRAHTVSYNSRIRCSDRVDIGTRKQSQDCVAPYYYLGYSCTMVIIGIVVILLVCLSGTYKATGQTHVLTSKCPRDTFPCVSDGKCVNASLLCNNKADCADGSDEGNICDRHMEDHWNNVFKKSNDTETASKSKSTECDLKIVPATCECQDRTKVVCQARTLVSVPTSLSSRTTSLQLSENPINNISREQFQLLPELQVLYMNHAQLTTIAPGTFTRNRKLNILYLNFNLLMNFTTEIFSAQNVVQEIHIKGNKLTELQEGDFTNMSKLVQLVLSRNTISSIQENAFGVLPSLEVLDLSYNQIAEIQPHYFRNLTSLKRLYLSQNRISVIQPYSFLALTNLENLQLDNNAIERLDNGVFDGLGNLSLILLAHNKISKIQSKAFKDLANVKSMDLRCNPVRHLDNYTFRALLSLDYIYFDKFYMCLYANQARNCEPQGDGISSKQNLLGSIILRVCVWLVALLACAGNLIVILGRFLMKEDNQIHSFYIKNLSLADLLMSFYLFVIAANDMRFRGDYIMYDELWRNSWECHLSGFLSTLSTEMSVLTLSVITLDRYISVMYPLYFRKQGLKCAYLVMVVTWLLSILLAALPVMGIRYFGSSFYSDNAVCVPLHLHEPRAKGWEYSSFIFLGINLGSFAFIAYAYSAMFYGIHNSALTLRTSRECQELSLVKRFFFIVLTDFMCWVPIIIIKIMALSGIKISQDLYAWVIVFALPVNAALNPLLYTLTTNLFKKKLLSKFTIVFRTNSTPSPSSCKMTSLARQMPDCEMDLLKNHSRSPSRCTVKTYLSPRVSDFNSDDNRAASTPATDITNIYYPSTQLRH